MKKYKPYLGRVDLVKNQVAREELKEQEAKRKRSARVQQQNKQRWLKYQEQLRSELAARYFHGVVSAGGDADTFSNTYSVAFDGVDDRTETSVNYSEFDGETRGTFSVLKVGIPFGRRTFEIELLVSTTTTFRFLIAQAGSGKQVSADIGNLKTDGLWHHILFCADFNLSPDTDKTRLFLDGLPITLSGGITLLRFPSHPATLTVGGTTQSNKSFVGNLDEVALWSGTDLRDDVATIYNDGVPNDLNNNGLTAPTTWYRFEEGSGTTITDNGTTTYDLSLISDSTYSTDIPE